MTWREALEDMARCDLLIVPWEGARGAHMKDVCAEAPQARRIGIVIGPEGGMDAGEIEALMPMSAQTVTLGPRILRTETAAVVSVAVAMTLWGDL